jgi:hypothetical protein
VSLSARDRQALSSIENELTQSATDLAAKLAEFTRLTVGAAMPEVEQKPARRWRPAVRLTGWLRRLTRRRRPGAQPDRSHPGTTSRP